MDRNNQNNNGQALEELSEKKASKKLNKDALRRSRQLLRYLRPYRWPFILSLILLTLSSSVFLVFPWASGELIAIANNRSSFGLTFQSIGLILLGLLVFQAVTSYVRTLLITSVAEKV